MESLKKISQLDAVETEQKANSSTDLSGVKENDEEKTTELALEILKKVDPEIGKNKILSVYRLKNKRNDKKENYSALFLVKVVSCEEEIKYLIWKTHQWKPNIQKPRTLHHSIEVKKRE